MTENRQHLRNLTIDIGAFVIRITTPIVLVMLVAASLWYASCRSDKGVGDCGQRMENVSETFLVVACVLVTFPFFCFVLTTCVEALTAPDVESP